MDLLFLYESEEEEEETDDSPPQKKTKLEAHVYHEQRLHSIQIQNKGKWLTYLFSPITNWKTSENRAISCEELESDSFWKDMLHASSTVIIPKIQYIDSKDYHISFSKNIPMLLHLKTRFFEKVNQQFTSLMQTWNQIVSHYQFSISDTSTLTLFSNETKTNLFIALSLDTQKHQDIISLFEEVISNFDSILQDLDYETYCFFKQPLFHVSIAKISFVNEESKEITSFVIDNLKCQLPHHISLSKKPITSFPITFSLDSLKIQFGNELFSI